MLKSIFDIRLPIYNYMTAAMVYTSVSFIVPLILFLVSFSKDVGMDSFGIGVIVVSSFALLLFALYTQKYKLKHEQRFHHLISLFYYLGAMTHIIGFLFFQKTYAALLIFFFMANAHVLISLSTISSYFVCNHHLEDIKRLGYDYRNTPTLFKLNYMRNMTIVLPTGLLTVGYGQLKFNNLKFDLMDMEDYFKEHGVNVEHLSADDFVVLDMIRY